jgi:hypothetical protein
VIAQLLHILIGGAVGRFGHFGYIVEQCSFSWAKSRAVKVAVRYSLYCFRLCSLNTQEVCMRVQSIRTAVEP